jgi:hypothetical protein
MPLKRAGRNKGSRLHSRIVHDVFHCFIVRNAGFVDFRRCLTRSGCTCWFDRRARERFGFDMSQSQF